MLRKMPLPVALRKVRRDMIAAHGETAYTATDEALLAFIRHTHDAGDTYTGLVPELQAPYRVANAYAHATPYSELIAGTIVCFSLGDPDRDPIEWVVLDHPANTEHTLILKCIKTPYTANIGGEVPVYDKHTPLVRVH